MYRGRLTMLMRGSACGGIEFRDNIAHSQAGIRDQCRRKRIEARNIRIHHNWPIIFREQGILFGLWGGKLLRSDIHIYNNTFMRVVRMAGLVAM